MKKYILFLCLGPVSAFLWAFWCLPSINEQGTLAETIEWFSVQLILPILLAFLLRFKKKYVFGILFVYGVFIFLHALGILGWAFMGPATPLSIYAVAVILFVMSLALIYLSLKSLNIGKAERYYGLDFE